MIWNISADRAVQLRKAKYRLAWKYQRTCVYCGWFCHDWRIFTLDHIKPLSKGGTDDIANLVLSCAPCNSAKADNWEERPIDTEIKACYTIA